MEFLTVYPNTMTAARSFFRYSDERRKYIYVEILKFHDPSLESRVRLDSSSVDDD